MSVGVVGRNTGVEFVEAMVGVVGRITGAELDDGIVGVVERSTGVELFEFRVSTRRPEFPAAATSDVTELDSERLRLSWSLSVLSPCSSSASRSSLLGDLSPRRRRRLYSGD